MTSFRSLTSGASRWFLLAVCIYVNVVSVSVAQDVDRPPLDRETRKAVDMFNEFGEKVYRQLSRSEGNVFLSPLSISAVVGMIHLGARGNTAREIEAILELRKHGVNGTAMHEAASRIITALAPLLGMFDLQFANGVFVTDGLQVNVGFRDRLDRYYRAGLYSAPLRDEPEEAVADLNSWVKDQTRGRIPILLERPLPPTIPMVILNAVYFKGDWHMPFDSANTTRSKFYGAHRVRDDAELMYQEGPFHYVDTKDYQAVEIPYKGEDVAMVVVLPKDTKDLYRLEQTLSYKDLRNNFAEVIKRKVKLTLPKFSLSLAYDMRGPLQDVGLNSMFSPRHANLTGISRYPVLAIDTIYHKALVEVNEKGTEALATTAGIHRHSNLMNQEVAEFRADRPFLFVIEDIHSNVVLFVGRVSDV